MGKPFSIDLLKHVQAAVNGGQRRAAGCCISAVTLSRFDILLIQLFPACLRKIAKRIKQFFVVRQLQQLSESPARLGV